MCPASDASEERQEVVFLNNLREDLHVLESSWGRKRLNRKKILRQLIDILDSVLDIARGESLEPFEAALEEVRTCLTSSTGKKSDIEKQPWDVMSEIMDLLTQSIREGAVPVGALEACRSRWNGESASREATSEEPAGDFSHPDPSYQAAGGEAESSAREEDEMANTDQTDPKKLLQKAQQALLSGNGESAKELAFKAAELIAKQEAEETERKREILKADLEVAAQLEAEAEEAFRHIKEHVTERQQEIDALTAQISENESSLEERKHAHQQIKDAIESAEAELAALKEKHQQLLEQFQEALPARDAAERERVRLKSELEKAENEIVALQEGFEEAEHQLTQTRQQRQEIEAKLEKLAEKVPA